MAPRALLIDHFAPAREGAEERGLTLLTHRAVSHASREAPLPEDLALAAREALEELPLDLLRGRYAMFEPAVRRALPASVVESWRFYTGTLEVLGLAEVHILDLALCEAHEDVYVVRVTADDGEGYLEVYGEDGEPLASGHVRNGQLSSWEERALVRQDARRRSRARTAALCA